MESGMIILWSGSVLSIPSGYVLCDGNNGTPNLQNRFVLGAGDAYAVDVCGGNMDHTHAYDAGSHTHAIQSGKGFGTTGEDYNSNTASAGVSGNTDNPTQQPTYYALDYIMKI